jgi:hypothetical protein
MAHRGDIVLLNRRLRKFRAAVRTGLVVAGLVVSAAAFAQNSGLESLSFIKKLKLARAGDTEAQLSVAIDYESGINQARKDPVQAARWYREAALAGNLEAQHRLARLIARGAPGLTADGVAAIKLLKDSADKGYAPSQNEYGMRLQNGDGVAADPAAAAAMFQKAADQNDVSAQVNLGLLYVKGLGVPQDFAAAFKLFDAAAVSGDPWALNNLGSMYEMGWGTSANAAKARELYEKSASQGNRLAADNLRRLSAAETTPTTTQP